jgi:hypothetical protein
MPKSPILFSQDQKSMYDIEMPSTELILHRII